MDNIEKMDIQDIIAYLDSGDATVQEVQAIQAYLKNKQGDYIIPFINPATEEELGVVKPDGISILADADGTISAVSGGGGREMFEICFEDHVLSYAESKNKTRLGEYAYKTAVAGQRWGFPTFYNTCIKEMQSVSGQTITVGVYSFTGYKLANGHIYYDISQKSIVDSIYNTYGIAMYYGVDTANERILMPRNDWFFQNGTNIGQINQGGLPSHTHTRGTMDITGALNFGHDGTTFRCGTDGSVQTGAFYIGPTSSTKIVDLTSGNYTGGSLSFQGSRSWTGSTSAPNYTSTIANTNTVQPPSAVCAVYIITGNTVSDTSWVDAVTQVESGVKDIEDAKNVALEEINTQLGSLKSYPKTYLVNGLIARTSDNVFRGIGTATITLFVSGLAKIDFSFSINQIASKDLDYTYGLDRDLIKNLNSNIPVITPIAGGFYQVFNSTGDYRGGTLEFGGMLGPASTNYWSFGRIYTAEGAFGLWQSMKWNKDDHFTGVCYGTYEVGSEG